MNHALPGLILTVASGFVGRNFIKASTGRYRLFCVARRSMEKASVQPDANLRWIQVDIPEQERLHTLLQRVRGHGGADYVVNLAGYYDYTNQDHPIYPDQHRRHPQHARNRQGARCQTVCLCQFPGRLPLWPGGHRGHSRRRPHPLCPQQARR